MILYRANLSIRYDNDVISIAKDSTALNIRIYKMSKGNRCRNNKLISVKKILMLGEK